jgi:NAD(P)-dependent dehydrogenase (short-subunit alcohol dehydrogenase family)
MQFDFVTNINYRGLWLSSRFEIAQMLKQEPLQTHDGRAGNRGAIVNIASQLGIVSTYNARRYFVSRSENQMDEWPDAE